MGKGKQKLHRHSHRHHHHHHHHEEDDPLPSSAFDPRASSPSRTLHPAPFVDEPPDYHWEGPSKHHLYQLSVQSPKGDISYLQKFFFTYIGGRSPLHLREDFCGTALICAEWVKGGVQRVATGLDLDSEALLWGLKNNIENLGADACSRVRLFHGNVLQPISVAKVIESAASIPLSVGTEGHSLRTVESEDLSDGFSTESLKKDGLEKQNGDVERDVKLSDARLPESVKNDALKNKCNYGKDDSNLDDSTSPWRHVDIVCAFNYSCCCLQKRSDLVSYFKYALESLNNKGGIFAMDIYGGVSSECPLKLRRHFHDFTYLWEQEAFDVVNRTTVISLHFQLKNNRMIRHAFTYHWRLWSLPELRDCLEEAGFNSIHIWVREMPALQGTGDNEDIEDDDSQYEEVNSFHQQSAWNAYIVAVALKK